MTTVLMYRTRLWLKQGNTPLARNLFRLLKSCRQLQLPRIPLLFSLFYRIYLLVTNSFSSMIRVLWWTPLFRSQVIGTSRALYLYGGLPLLSDGLQIHVGDRCRISGHTTFSARAHALTQPLLFIGDNVDVGWQTTIAVGQRVMIHDNVRMAGGCFLAGYPGHPLDAKRRALGEPEDESQVGDIVLEEDVWLATGVKVMAGVTIGRGSIVAAGSVVTTDLPAGVLAGGVPARVIRHLEGTNHEA
ncbi:acyltransferase [Echinimonas agarilytica]|uniref:Acyltransferase n=1 Tax=Echinimonas agarilytica TaxID=1215918 RepID=A0AA42B7L4_9GAMM|nr:acyltransferase [Echinimonas agarilytica]MCM2679538.1 acyltransferase [Echinimonas agarilytica]